MAKIKLKKQRLKQMNKVIHELLLTILDSVIEYKCPDRMFHSND